MLKVSENSRTTSGINNKKFILQNKVSHKIRDLDKCLSPI